MSFAHPEWLIWLWIIPIAAVLCWAGYKRRRRRLALFAGHAQTTRQLSPMRSSLKAILLLGAMSALVVAAAQPRWGFEWREVRASGLDIMVAVDVSNSMLATDVDPNRMERAKRKVIDLLSLLQGDRIGLVAFAGEAFVQCPITEDYNAARMFVSYLGTDLIPVQGTDLGQALRVATKALLDGSRGESQGKAIILITDGEDQEGNADAAAVEAKDKGIYIYTVGIGGGMGAPIPEVGGGFKKDAAGNVVMSKPDEAVLQRIAAATGGAYVRAIAGDWDLSKLYADGIRKTFGVREGGATTRKQLWHERFQWFVGFALLALMIDFFLRDLSLAAGASVVFLAVLPTINAKPALAADNGTAAEAFAAGDYESAAKDFLEAEIEDPSDPTHAYNRSVSQYRAGQFEAAAEGFAKAARASEGSLRQRSLFNLGNTQVELKRYDAAIEAYEKALQHDPNDQEAKDNLEFAKKLKSEPQPPQEGNDARKKEGSRGEQQQAQPQSDPQQNDGAENLSETSQEGGQEGSGSQQDTPPENAAESSDASNPENGQGPQTSDQQQAQAPSDHGEHDASDERRGQAAQEGPDSHNSEAEASKAASTQALSPSEAMSQQQADQVLRSVQDDPRRFLGPQRSRNRRSHEKDW